jgi:hypothetical protein
LRRRSESFSGFSAVWIDVSDETTDSERLPVSTTFDHVAPWEVSDTFRCGDGEPRAVTRHAEQGPESVRGKHSRGPRALNPLVENAALDLPGDTVGNMSSRMRTRRRRSVLALVLAAVAVGLVVVEPFPKGKVLLSLTSTHGVDTGDIPALVMLLVAVGLAI